MSTEGNNKSDRVSTGISPLESEMAIKVSESTGTDKMVHFSATQNNQNTSYWANSENNNKNRAECEEIFKEISRDSEVMLEQSRNRKDNSDVYNAISVINSGIPVINSNGNIQK